MKAVAVRSRDLSDIEGILDAHAKLDLRRIRRQARELALADRPEIIDNIEKLLAQRRLKNKRRPKG
jgi:hypothetical protein